MLHPAANRELGSYLCDQYKMGDHHEIWEHYIHNPRNHSQKNGNNLLAFFAAKLVDWSEKKNEITLKGVQED